jgi:hypothetical protein
MQIMLGKGEENDWFASNLIRTCAFLFFTGIVGLIWWELRGNNPVMSLRLFKYKNFAICCFLMILVGGVLNASTVLQPQFIQQLLGYTATLAAEALMGAGLALLVMMPLADIVTGRFPARNMAALGFTGFACAFFDAPTHINLTMSFGFASWLRIIQMMPIPFCFISITNTRHCDSEIHLSSGRADRPRSGVQLRIHETVECFDVLVSAQRERSEFSSNGACESLSAIQSAGVGNGILGHLSDALLDVNWHDCVRLPP